MYAQPEKESGDKILARILWQVAKFLVKQLELQYGFVNAKVRYSQKSED